MLSVSPMQLAADSQLSCPRCWLACGCAGARARRHQRAGSRRGRPCARVAAHLAQRVVGQRHVLAEVQALQAGEPREDGAQAAVAQLLHAAQVQRRQGGRRDGQLRDHAVAQAERAQRWAADADPDAAAAVQRQRLHRRVHQQHVRLRRRLPSAAAQQPRWAQPGRQLRCAAGARCAPARCGPGLRPSASSSRARAGAVRRVAARPRRRWRRPS